MKRKLRAIVLMLAGGVAILLFIGISSLPLLFLASITVQDQIVMINWSRTVGTITNKSLLVATDDNPHSFWITYTFVTGKGELVESVNPSAPWSSMKVGDKIEIAYDPENPKMNLIVKSGFLPWVGILLSFIGLAGIACGAYSSLQWFIRKVAKVWKGR